jgi:hypothetical protein
VASYVTPVSLVRGRLFVPVPFDPDREWTPKPQHHIHGTKRRPDVRAQRIVEMVTLLEAGAKERPKT